VSPGARATAGTWVQIHLQVLEAGNRLSQVPPETQAVALEMRVRGIALHDAALGEPVEIRTAAGRVLRGTLVDLAPRYEHDFGDGVPELVLAGLELADRRRGAAK
jgi:2-amino-4-ketopentanoate thiolase alpha subunit